MTDYDKFLAALMLWRENRGGTMPQMQAIWSVVQNRANDARKRWPRTIAGVILQPFQFSSFNIGDPNATKFPLPQNELDWNAFQRAQIVVNGSLDADPTEGANAYETLPDSVQKPEWCDPTKITLTLGPFRFYKL